jgi:DNA polymerase-3 subunit alpha
VGEQAMEVVVKERNAHGGYKDIFDFASRVPPEALNKRALEHLIKAGAFDVLHPNRAALFAQIDAIAAYGTAIYREKESNQVSLFAASAQPSINTPKLSATEDWTTLERLEYEFSAIGFYLSSHPLADYEVAIKKLGVLTSNEFNSKLSAQYRPVKVAGIVTGKKFKVSDKGRFAFIQLSDLGGVFEVSVFNELLLIEHRDNLENGKVLLLQADAKCEEAGVRLIAQSISLLDDAVKKVYERGATRFRIVVNESEAIAPLRAVLGEGGKMGAQVCVRAQINAVNADIELPGKYMLTPALLDRLRVIKGVVLAEEIAA